MMLNDFSFLMHIKMCLQRNTSRSYFICPEAEQLTRGPTLRSSHIGLISAIGLLELFIILGLICGFLVKSDGTKYMEQR